MNPTYTDLLKQIGTQLNLRKKYLFLRTLMIVWPFLLAGIAVWIGNSYFGKEVVEDTLTTFPYGLYVGIYALLSIIYTMIVSFIFNIEKRIWIDSFFDKRELLPAQSWMIARKLFWPAFMFRVRVFVRYYLVPVVILLGVVGFSIFGIIQNTVTPFIFLGLSIIAFIIYAIYNYYLGLRLRFSWFVFLDMYKGEQTDMDMIFQDIEKLHAITKGENFVKAIVVTLGASSIQAVINMAVATVALVSRLATGGRGEGFAILRIFTQELARQIASYAQIAGFYLLYMVARTEAFGEKQEVNEYVYGLK